ncbi:hypothetical protein TAMA11512_00580 [Selenomonas sp. TAMA-11512]|nr:hypothetical protein TAMA11512_00580 [Selenomonas sp. TAMA-11512]
MAAPYAIRVPKTTDEDFAEHRMAAYVDATFMIPFYAYPAADKAYIYCTDEGDRYYADCFFEVNGKIVKKDQLNAYRRKDDPRIYDTSAEQQAALLKSIAEGMQSVQSFYDYYREPVPTEIRIIYDIKGGSLEAEHSYTEIGRQTKHPALLFVNWMHDIRREHASTEYRRQASARRKGANVLRLP